MTMRNLKKTLLLVIILGLVAACLAIYPILRSTQRKSLEQELLRAEDYQVYSALIQSVPAEVTGTPILIDDKIRKRGIFTESGKGLVGFYKDLLPEILQDTLVDFIAKNEREKQPSLQPKFTMKHSYVLLQEDDLFRDFLHKKKRILELREAHKGAKHLLYFSRIGYSEKKDQAFLIFGVAGEESSSLFCVLMKKIDDDWIVGAQKSLSR